MTLFDKGLSTTFQPFKDAQGHCLSSAKRLKMQRLRRWNYRAQRYTSLHRNLTQAMHAVTLLAEALHIPRAVTDTAAVFYRKTLSLDLVKGRSIKSIAAASLYLACRLSQTPRSLKQVADASPRSRKEIARCYRLLLRELSIHIPVDSPTKYVPEIASKVGLDQQTQNEALALLTHATQQFAVTGKAPKGMAAAALYIASIRTKQKITQRAIAKASGVTEVTIRNRYKQLKHDLKISVYP
jgi:transcription initiation factor TFIIB